MRVCVGYDRKIDGKRSRVRAAKGRIMDIKRAKEEIKNTVKAYLAKDDNGNPLIPEMHQRPILLIGPPGIGKTAVMEQAARECGIGLAAYTMTHHTRQSAMGLPFIEKKIYDGQEYSVTSYTMSEIIASVHDIIENTGLKEGILFIDEINCVSETLSPVMLQFLQAKTFGNAKVPKGWIIVAAGNPAEYNRSVREFDVVTLDRVKLINIEPDYAIWKEYALKYSVHQAIISYLDARQENFYRIETTVEGKRFVTARGWEDLSDMIKAYEKFGMAVDEQVAAQYLQQPDVAMDFANYLSLYYKYEKVYNTSDILAGNTTNSVKERLKAALFDERISVVSLILGALNVHFKKYYISDKVVTELYNILKSFQKDGDGGFGAKVSEYRGSYNIRLANRLLDTQGRDIGALVIKQMEQWELLLKENGVTDKSLAFETLAGEFAALSDDREQIADTAGRCLENAFDFGEAAFGQGPELVLFVTELAAGFYSLNFIQENGCERFYKYNKSMLRDSVRSELIDEIEKYNY